MIRFLNEAFYVVYKMYTRWEDVDAFDHSAFVIGVLIASTVNFIFTLLFIATGCEFLGFNLFPVGVILVVIIISCIYYFRKRKASLIMCYESKQKSNPHKKNLMMKITLLLMFSTWFITPFLY